MNKFLFTAVIVLLTPPASAQELMYRLQSPLLGGNNTALYQAESSRLALENQRSAKRESERKTAESEKERALLNSPATRFANALQSQLFMSISQQLSQKIASVPAGQTGSFQSGDVLVSYTNEGAFVSVNIITPQGSSTIQLPTGQQ